VRYLVLSDIHANLEALQEVLTDAEGAEYGQVIFLGDLVGYGPNPNECVDLVRTLPLRVSLVGNHDLAALGRLDLSAFNPQARAAALWTATRLRTDVAEYLSSLRPSAANDGFASAHASPRDPVWEYLEFDYQGQDNFDAFAGPLCFVGHTHQARVFEQSAGSRRRGLRVFEPRAGDHVVLGAGHRLIINPGGVGQPRDGDPRASYGIWDVEAGWFEYRRVEYPIPVTQRKILAAGLPSFLAARLASGV
jgi:predicted phosphodiesterase